MSKIYSTIPPFPSHIDRYTFGHWLSGFTDGEGCFMLDLCHASRRYQKQRYMHYQCRARFAIGLREDDRPILETIQSFFQCGELKNWNNQKLRDAGGGAGNQARFVVRSHADLTSIIIPHFDRFPLRAKKAKDFAIWRQGCEFLREAKMEKRGNTKAGWRRWTPERVTYFRSLIDTLKAQRVCNSSLPTMPILPTKMPSLFD